MLRQVLRRVTVQTPGEGFTDLTALLNGEIQTSGLRLGTATLVCLHTSCSLTINENADPRVLHDLTAFARSLVPQKGIRPSEEDSNWRRYHHDDEGPDDMPSHIRTALTSTTLSLSFDRGALVLGTWQAIYLWEHRHRGHRRCLSLHLVGE